MIVVLINVKFLVGGSIVQQNRGESGASVGEVKQKKMAAEGRNCRALGDIGYIVPFEEVLMLSNHFFKLIALSQEVYLLNCGQCTGYSFQK